MRKALLAVVAVVVLVVAGWFAVRAYATTQENRASKVAWPGNLGPLDDASKRFPDAEQSEGATKLVQLANAAQLDLAPRKRTRMFEAKRPNPADAKKLELRKAIGEYLKAQFERSGDAIDAPPPIVAQYLAENETALDAVRDHLLSDAPIVWETKLRKGFDAPIPNLAGHMALQKILAARAFDKARRGDPAAWEELRAGQRLNRGFWSRPDLISNLIALASSRMTNAAARKMPLPTPAWLTDTFTFDYSGAMAASQQAEAWTIHHSARRRASREITDRFQSAEYLDVMRTYTTEALKSRACDVASPEFAAARASLSTSPQLEAIPNLVSAWHRLMRFRAELEATERVLQLRAGEKLTVNSQCSDGTWQLTPNGMKFSRDVKVTSSETKYPLEYVR